MCLVVAPTTGWTSLVHIVVAPTTWTPSLVCIVVIDAMAISRPVRLVVTVAFSSLTAIYAVFAISSAFPRLKWENGAFSGIFAPQTPQNWPRFRQGKTGEICGVFGWNWRVSMHLLLVLTRTPRLLSADCADWRRLRGRRVQSPWVLFVSCWNVGMHCICVNLRNLRTKKRRSGLSTLPFGQKKNGPPHHATGRSHQTPPKGGDFFA